MTSTDKVALPGRRGRASLAACIGVSVSAGLMLGALALGRGGSAPAPGAGATPGMQAVIAASRPAGSTDPASTVHLNLGLRGRDPAGLDRLLRAGLTVRPNVYVDRFGPDPQAVAGVVAALRAHHMAATWSPGSTILAVDGPAADAERLLGVHFDEYVGPDGRGFRAADRAARLPASLAADVTSVDGLDTYARVTPFARPAKEGLSPQDVRDFYNIDTLITHGFDGTGETILIPGYQPSDSDLKAYTDRFHLPPLVYQAQGTVPQDKEGQGETMLDLEVSHAIAPAAKLLLFPAPASFQSPPTFFVRMNDLMVTAAISGAIVDESYGWCEPTFDAPSAQQLDGILQRGAAIGMSFFVSTGDEGAYGCFRQDKGRQSRITAELPAADPWVTAVGGTSVTLAATSGYGHEIAWGNPIRGAGGGGGMSGTFARPDWQTGTGVGSLPDDNGKRLVPDVAGLADANTGWAVASGGTFSPVGGTSASAPLWAAIAADINTFLVRQGVRRVGFANPALYSIGQNDGQLPGPPLHPVVGGNNLRYAAVAGYNLATGWGTPNAGALAAAWAAYLAGGGR